MNKPEKKEDLLAEAKELINTLSRSLPKRVDPVSISLRAKIPFKALDYREVLCWRTEELARISYELYERGELASATTLTRACMENAAAIWYLNENIKKVIEAKEVGNIDDTLMKLLLGSKSDLAKVDAINVMSFIDRVDKDIPGFRGNYETMCEFAHPNWLGTAYLYSNTNTEKIWTDLGKDVRNTESVVVHGLISLNLALSIFQHSYKKMSDLMPEFIMLCENALAQKNKSI